MLKTEGVTGPDEGVVVSPVCSRLEVRPVCLEDRERDIHLIRATGNGKIQKGREDSVWLEVTGKGLT